MDIFWNHTFGFINLWLIVMTSLDFNNRKPNCLLTDFLKLHNDDSFFLCLEVSNISLCII